MRAVSNKDRAVSEVIGFVLIFAIVISLFSTLVTYYVPATTSAYEHDYQASSMYAMSKFSNTMSTPGYVTGQVLNDYVPLGIQGGIFSPGRQTSVTYSKGGLSGSVSYGVGVSFAYSQHHPTNAVLNKLIKTFPRETLTQPIAELYDPIGQYLYVAGYQTNNIGVISPNNGSILTYAYAGGHPKAMVLDPQDHMIYVLNNLTLSATGYNYFTVSEVSTLTHKFVAFAAILQQVNVSQQPSTTFNVSSITYDTNTSSLYVSYAVHQGSGLGSHFYDIAQIDPSTLKVTNLVTVSKTNNIVNVVYDQSSRYLVGLSQSISSGANPQYAVIDPTSLNIVANVSINFQGFYSTYGYNGVNGSARVSSNNYSSYISSLSTNPALIVLGNVFPDSNKLYFTFNITNPTQALMNSYAGNRYNLPAPGIVSVNFSNTNSVENISSIAQFYGNTTIIPWAMNDSSMYSSGLTQNLAATVYSPALTKDFIFDFNLSGYYNFNSTNAVSVPRAATAIVSFPSGSNASYSVTSSSTSTEAIFHANDNNLTYVRTIQDAYFSNPYAIAYDPVNQINERLYVTNYGADTVAVLNPNTNQLAGSIFLGKGVGVTNITVNTVTGTVYVVETNANAIGVIDGLSLVTVIPLDARPAGIGYNPSHNSTYVTGFTSNGVEFFNISGTTIVDNATLTNLGNGVYLGPIVFNPYNDFSYAAVGTSSGKNWNLYAVESVFQRSPSYFTLKTLQKTPDIGTAFNTYTGALYVADYASAQLYIYANLYSQTATTFNVGSQPVGLTFDAGNNLLYVSNSGSSNVTVIDTTNNSILATIWIGGGPQFSVFDSDNGYVFFPDYLSNQLSVIDGGFTVFSGKKGVFMSGSQNIGGTISTTGNTVFVTPENYIIQDGALVSNVTNSAITKPIQGIPLSIVNHSGQIYFSDVSTNLLIPGGGSSVSIASNSPTNLKTQITSVVNDTYSKGTNFFITDIYGNNYPAIVTALYLEEFNLSLFTRYASDLNDFAYQHYTGNSGNAPISWTIPGVPMNVTLNGDSLSFSLTNTVTLYFVSIEVYQVSLLEM